MRRVWIILLACLLAGAMAACGAAGEDAEAPAQDAPAAAETTAVPETEEAPQTLEIEEPAEPEDAEPAAEDAAPDGPTVEDALACVDQDVSVLYEAIGEPLTSAYEASCAGDGDDGVLEYEGFTVFTYREPDGSAETVIDAE